jgi:hypothetical protein
MSPAAALGPLLALAACASVAAPRLGSISEVTLERDCFGCETSVAMVLRSDGTASLRHTGKARFGTSDRSMIGTVSRTDFDRLAALLVSQGFFELRDEYRDPALADGAWVSTGAMRDGRRKRVLDSNAAGPAELRAVEDALEAVRARIAWVPAAP